MAAINISLLSELYVYNDDCTIKVRIIRLWRQPAYKNPTATLFYGMVFLDEQGNKMQATVVEKWYKRFAKLLVEKDCLIIKSLSIVQDSPKYKYLDNPLKGTFTSKTIVTQFLHMAIYM
ncbi:putative nucleic acid-binding protein [Helianthus annuus]|nr:putative nucleic acid-binding protein [Helianthus annuus]